MEKLLCLCGCEEEVKLGNKFVHGHHRKGQKLSEETKAKMSVAMSGENNSMFGKDLSGINNPMFGKHHSEETKAKMSVANSGENCSLETRRKMSVANSGENNFNFGKDHSGKKNGHFGKQHSEETKAKISLTSAGRKHSEETKAKISIARIGKHCSEETKAKLSFLNSGENSPNWKGGIAYKPYGPGDNEELKEQIRRRDNYSCQECKIVWIKKEEKFVVHHIDYDKKNHVPWNRITLCHSCHSKTNNNNRDYWTEHFYEINFNNCIQWIFR